MKKVSSKILAIMLSFAVVLSMMPGMAFAGGTVSADVYISYQPEANGFALGKQKVTVSSDEADKYGYIDKISKGDSVSALDVLVKAHEIYFQKETLIKPGDEGYTDYLKTYISYALDVSKSGWVNKFFENPSGFGFAVNGEASVNTNSKYPESIYGPESYASNVINEAEVTDGDYVQFFKYRDLSYCDNMTWFEQSGKKVEKIVTDVNKSLTLKAKGYAFMSYGSAVDSSYRTGNELSDAKVTIFNSNGDVTELNKITDDNGNVELSFNYSGTYIVSISGNEKNGEFFINPWLEIKVVDYDQLYSESSKSVYVTIEDSTKGYVTEQPLSVGWFDITPYMSGSLEGFSQSSSVTTGNALIEAVYYSIYKEDPSIADLEDPEKIANVKGQLIISNGKYGLSQNSVFGNENLSMSAINDESCSFGIGSQTIKSNDDIVFYEWTSNLLTAAVRGITHKVVTDEGKTYQKFNLRIYAEETGDQYAAAAEGATAKRTTDAYGLSTADANGVIDASFNETAEKGENSFVVEVSKDGLQSAFFRVSYKWDGSNISEVRVSQEVSADTSLASAYVTIGDNSVNVLPYIRNNLEFEVGADVETVKLSLSPTDPSANISGIDDTEKNKIENKDIVVSNGLNNIEFTVKNGSFSEKYSLKINRKKSDVAADVDSVINGVFSNITSNSADYIIGKVAAGKTVSEAEKDAFLKNVLNMSYYDSSCGSAAKVAIALTALGIDARSIPVKTPAGSLEESYNLVQKVYSANYTNASYVTQLPYVLYLTDLGVYSEGAAEARKKVIDEILTREADWATAGYGGDTTAMVIQALAPYYNHSTEGYNGISAEKCASIKEKVDIALANYITNSQDPIGTYGGNANTTAAVLEMLVALGKDPQSSEYTKAGTGKNVLTSLFIYKTTENTLGYTTTTENTYASIAGANALVAYKEFVASGNKYGSIYDNFRNKEVSVLYEWPDRNTVTGLIVTPKKSSYNVGETISSDDLTVKAIYNNEIDNQVELRADQYTLKYDELTSFGTKLVTVTYNGFASPNVKTSYNITVGSVVSADTISFRIEGLDRVVSDSAYAFSSGETVMDALNAICNRNGLVVSASKGYVSAIGGKAEFDEGPNSGWMYRVNGVAPTYMMSEYTLKKGDSVVVYYVQDYTKDPYAIASMPSEDKAPTISITDKDGKDASSMGKVEYDATSNCVDITPSSGYKVSDVKVNGVSKGAVTRLEGIKATDRIEVVFEAASAESETPAVSDQTAKIIAGVQAIKPKVTNTRLKSGIKVYWKKNSSYKVSYYQVYRKTGKNGTYKLIYTTKLPTTLKITNVKNLKKGKTYYYRVRGVRVIDGKKYYTKWSNYTYRKFR